MNKLPFNIAYEISPLLTASGVFGDKSGVYRYTYNLLKNLAFFLEKSKLPHQIYLFTLNPQQNQTMGLSLNELIKFPNIKLIQSDNISPGFVTGKGCYLKDLFPIKYAARTLAPYYSRYRKNVYMPIILTNYQFLLQLMISGLSIFQRQVMLPYPN